MPHIVPLTPAFLVAAANSFIGLVDEPGEPWATAFIHHVGYYSHYDHGSRFSSWPLPATATCYELGLFAEKKGILAHHPEVGDVFLLYDKELGRFAHAGIVVGVEESDPLEDVGVHICTTIEGNTNHASRNGNATQRKVRRFRELDCHRFIRWVNLDRRLKAA